MDIDWGRIANPVLDREPDVSVRDPALVYHEGILRCFHTAAEKRPGGYRLFLDVSESRDLAEWSEPARLTTSELSFSSPGNVVRIGDKWVMCLQSYPIRPGEVYGSEDSRLWLMSSDDLVDWSAPELIAPAGCQAAWADTHRQIDPYLVLHDDKAWCFYKARGCLGLLVSEDMRQWREACPDSPALSSEQTPDGKTVENPCVVRDGDEFVMFFAPCREGRGIGVARSDDLLTWRDVRYLDFPDLPWAGGGPTAAMVLDLREECGRWLMAFHGERPGPHKAAMGLAWSDDLEHWTCP